MGASASCEIPLLVMSCFTYSVMLKNSILCFFCFLFYIYDIVNIISIEESNEYYSFALRFISFLDITHKKEGLREDIVRWGVWLGRHIC